MTAPIGAHASVLMSLRAKSLQAYGIDAKLLMSMEEHELAIIPENKTRALALSKKEERSLAVEHEHALISI